MCSDSILSRIRKLLALSTSSNPNEAATAAAVASELMAQHQVAEAELRSEDEPSEPVGDEVMDDGGRRQRVPWLGTLADGIARSFRCRTYWYGGALHIVGRGSGVQGACYTYRYLEAEIRRLSDRAKREVPDWQRRRFVNSFRLGAASVVRRRLLDQLAEQNRPEHYQGSSETALMCVRKDEQAVEEFYEGLGRKVSRSSRASHFDGWRSGREAGAGINLGGNRAIGAAPRSIRGVS